MESEIGTKRVGDPGARGSALATDCRWSRGPTLAAVALFVVVLWSAPAQALSQRGHSFAFSFAGEGEGEGKDEDELSNPDGVAVSEVGESAGDIYVVDRTNNRIEKFDQAGHFISAWGWGVKTEGSKTYEVCKAGEGCKAGTPGTGKGAEKFKLGKGQLVAPTAIAIDNSSDTKDPSRGDVYVIADVVNEKSYVQKYGPDGEYIGLLSNSEEEREFNGYAEGLAVDAKGEVWLDWSEGEISTFTDAEKNKRVKGPLEELEAGTEVEPLRFGLAIDAEQNVYVTDEPAGLFEASEETGYSEEGKNEDGEEPCSQAPCFAAKLTTVEEEEQGGNIRRPGEALIERFDQENTSDLAVDPNAQESPGDDVYLANGSSVVVTSPDGSLIERFGTKTEAGKQVPVLRESAGIAVNAARDVYVADKATGDIDVFTPEAPAAPTVESISVQDVSSEAAQLDATIDPRGATQQTNWYFEYGSGPCPAQCVKVPGGELGGPGFGDEGFGEQSVDVQLGIGTDAPLVPGSTYHYRVIAENAEHGQGVSDRGSFSTPPQKGDFIADERQWELVSPPEKDGASIEPLTVQGAVTQASQNGQALAYIANAPIGEPQGSRTLEPTQLLSLRGGAGWSSQDLETPNERANGFIVGKAPEYQFFSPDLALSLVEPWSTSAGVGGKLAEPSLSPPVQAGEEQERTIYLRDDEPLAPGPVEAEGYAEAERNGQVQDYPGYLALLSRANVTSGEPFGGTVTFLDATPDLSHVVILSKVALTNEAGGQSGGEDYLYEWTDGLLQLINLLPPAAPGEEGALASEAKLGALGLNTRNAISTDGARVFWSAGEHLYMRNTQTRQTMQVDKAEVSEPGAGAAIFQTASDDGSRVFFTDEQRLTTSSGASKGAPDLYVYEVASGKLTDLSPAHAKEGQEGADVQGLVLGTSEDGSYAYFVANGVLSGQAEEAGATAGHCVHLEGEEASPSGTTCNLYLEHFGGSPGAEKWEEPRFIATLSNEDQPDWAGKVREKGLGEVTSRVSPDGRRLAFMSEQSLTLFDGEPYDNRATAEGADDAPAEEVYEYSAPTGAAAASLACASCDPSGSRPVGVFDPTGAGENSEGLGLLVDRPRVWAGKWLAGSVPGWTKLDESYFTLYQSRYLSDSGRLFFDSPEALVAPDHNGKEDVYEYEPEGVPRGKQECTDQSATFSRAAGGCLALISSGTSPHESAFLDASESGGEGEHGEVLDEGGGDVFFVTAAPLSSQDVDQSFDAYDAHECTPASPCIVPPPEEPSAACQSSGTCRPYTPSSTSPPAAPVSAAAGAPGNLAQQKVLGTTTSGKPKPLTRAQKLARALKSCRAKHRHARKRRLTCERQARKRYGKKAKKTKHSARKSVAPGRSRR
jgi:WD40-like Beta Propeller Repeat